jgi:hypothetical protein
MKSWRLEILLAAGICFPLLCLPQTSRFVQAELKTAVNTKSIKVGDIVTAIAIRSVTLPKGGTIIRGAEIFGQVRAVNANSVAISFDEAELDGKKVPLILSIQGAMAPGSDPAKASHGTLGQPGSVIGMPGITLQVDDSPQHASRLESSGKKLQLKPGLQLMLAVPE